MATRIVTISGQARYNSVALYSEPSGYEDYVKREFENQGWLIKSIKFYRNLFSPTTAIAIEAYVNTRYSIAQVANNANELLSSIKVSFLTSYPLFTGVYLTAVEKDASKLDTVLTQTTGIDKINKAVYDIVSTGAGVAGNPVALAGTTLVLVLIAAGAAVLILKK